jgi:carbon storage regulator
MLVLSRKTNEAIVIGGNIEVVVVAIRGNFVKLGIQAPPSVPVHRAEVQRRIVDEAFHALQESK